MIISLFVSQGTYVTRVQVQGNSLDVNYFLAPEVAPNQNDVSWFQINSTNGVITVAKTLDREVEGFPDVNY